MTMWLVRSADTGRVMAWRVQRCDGWLERTVGFLPRTAIAPEEGLWFERCGAVHTLGMRLPLDIVFLDRALQVVHAERQVRPQRLYVGHPKAKIVAEFGPGFLDANPLAPGERLVLEPI